MGTRILGFLYRATVGPCFFFKTPKNLDWEPFPDAVGHALTPFPSLLSSSPPKFAAASCPTLPRVGGSRRGAAHPLPRTLLVGLAWSGRSARAARGSRFLLLGLNLL